MNLKVTALIFLVTALFTLASCTTGSPLTPTGQTGTLKISVDFSQASGSPTLQRALASEFTYGTVTLTKQANTRNANITVSGTRADVTVSDLEVGTWQILVRFYNGSSNLSWQGSNSVTIQAATFATANITLSSANGGMTLSMDLPITTLIQRMENATSEVGSNFSTVGSVIPSPAVYGNGLYLSETNYMTMSLNSMVSPTQGTVEFWFTPNWNLSTKSNQYRTITDSTTGSARFHIVFSDLNYLHINAFAAGTSMPDNLIPVSIVSGTPIHFALVWKSGGIDASGQTLRLYMNGVSVLGTNTSIDTSAISQTFHLGHHAFLSVPGARGVFDNLKVQSYAKTNFADRFVE